ncbi:hypothetical protein NYE48_10835 [Paenibacillus sp. FSL M7-1455]|uniref:hypothetical protein n=1 Tax=Paenibacillus sp. FSL M7-1455 TaxID=2975316 RepID=UPI0005431158|nr:hypothetical protein CM49_02558 [Paenibacillus sp. P1XP2]
MVMILIGIIMILLGLYDAKKPDSGLFRFLRRTPKTEIKPHEIRYQGEAGIFGGALFIVVGLISVMVKNFG